MCEHRLGLSDGVAVRTRRPPNGRSTASITRYPGRLKSGSQHHAASTYARSRLVFLSGWCLDNTHPSRATSRLHHRPTTVNWFRSRVGRDSTRLLLRSRHARAPSRQT